MGEVSVDPPRQATRMFPLPEFSSDPLAGGCVGHQRRVVNFYGPLRVGDLTLASLFSSVLKMWFREGPSLQAPP